MRKFLFYYFKLGRLTTSVLIFVKSILVSIIRVILSPSTSFKENYGFLIMFTPNLGVKNHWINYIFMINKKFRNFQMIFQLLDRRVRQTQ